METMSVWVGCLACYNGGTLRGRWVDAIEADDLTTEELHDGPSTHEELWCFDLDGFPGECGEMSPSDAARIAASHEELTEALGDDMAAFLAFVDNEHKSLTECDDEDVDRFRDAFRGEFDSLADYAQSLADEILPPNAYASWPFDCIDWEHAGEELRMAGDIWTHRHDGSLYIFDANA